MLSSVEQAFVRREEIQAPLKTTAWEATPPPALSKGLEDLPTPLLHLDPALPCTNELLQNRFRYIPKK